MIKKITKFFAVSFFIASILASSIVNAKEYIAQKNEVSKLLFSSKNWMDNGGDIFALDKILQDIEILIYEKKDKLINEKIADLKKLLSKTPVKNIEEEKLNFIKPELKDAGILFNRDGGLYTSDINGSNINKISMGKKYYNNYALSLDHNFLAIIYQVKNRKFLEIVNLSNGKRLQLLKNFHSVSDSGLMFDNQNRLYFIATKKIPFPNPTSENTALINNNFREIYRINFDGTGLEQITDSKKKIEGGFSFSKDYKKIIYTTKHSEDLEISYYEIVLRDLETNKEEVIYKHKDPVFNPIIIDKENIVFGHLIGKRRIIKSLNLGKDKEEVEFNILGFAISPSLGTNNNIFFQEISLSDNIIFAGISRIDSSGKNYKKIIFNAKLPKFVNKKINLDLKDYKNIRLVEILENSDYSLSAKFFDIKKDQEITVNFPKELISDIEKEKLNLIKTSEIGTLFTVPESVNGYVGYFENWKIYK